MALHEVQLKGYNVRPGNLSLGTFGSYGIEQLHVTLDDTWSGLAVTATFNPPKGEPREIRLPENGLIDVPAEATANEGTGTIVYCGVANGVQRITKTQGYNVITRGPVGGTEPFKPSESLATQVLQAALNAEKNSAEAKSVADNLRNDAANGKFDGKDGAKGDKGDKGDTGPRGPVGPQGPAGKDGVQIDDAAVSEDAPWSSKHIIDMLCPPLEESGNPVVCYPVAGYPLGVKAKWEPMQEGSGTPSPENIRPIKGRASVTVERCGANLSKISDISTPNKTLTPVELPTEIVADIEISFDTLNAEIKNVGTAFFLNKADGKWKAITVQDFGISTAGKIPNGRKTAVFHGVAFKTVETVIIENGYCKWSGNVNNFCVSLIQNAPYKPYIGQTATLTLPETVYGGEVDAVSGEGQETRKTITLKGTEKWNQIKGYFEASFADFGLPSSQNNITAAKESQHADRYIIDNPYMNTLSDKCAWVYNYVSSQYPILRIKHEAEQSTLENWKAYLAAQYAAGTPVQVCYKLATPTPFTATGAQPIPALAGVNTVLTDADSATVTGRADPIKRITDLEDAVASQT